MVLQCSSLASLLVLVIPRAGSYNQYAPVGGEYPNQPSPTAIQLDAMNFTSTKQFNEHGKWWYGEGDIFPWYGKLAGHKELYHPVRSACYGGTQNGFCKDESTNVVAAKYAPPSSSSSSSSSSASSSNTTGDGHRQRRERRERALLTARDTARDTAGRGAGRGVGKRRLGASSVGALSTAKFVTDAKPQDCLAASLTAKSSSSGGESSGESSGGSSGGSSGVKKGRRMAAAASSVASGVEGVEEAYDPVRCVLDGEENPLLCHEVQACHYMLHYMLHSVLHFCIYILCYIQCYVQVAVDII